MDDDNEPHLWPDADAQRYLDDACREAAERAFLIRDTTTTSVCQLAVLANVSTYTLHASILHVERAILASQRLPLRLTSTEEMDHEHPGWTALKSSKSTRALIDAEGGAFKLRLYPTPNVADTLNLAVFRVPLTSVSKDDDAPEFHVRYHERLIDWMERCAYLKSDTETRNEEKSLQADKRFTLSFGTRLDANMQRKLADRGTARVEFMEF